MVLGAFEVKGQKNRCQPFCSGLRPIFSARMIHKVSPSLVVKHVDAAELRVVAAAVVLAVAADALLVAQHLLKLGAHLVTPLARLHVQNLARRRSLEAGSTRE